MARPRKLYSHSVEPNPRRVRIFAAEKGINLTLEAVDILAGQSRKPEFLAKNSSGGVPVLSWMMARTFPSRLRFAGMGSSLFRTLPSAELSANLSAAPPFHTRWLLYTVLSKQQNKIIRNCVGAHSREADATLRKIEDAAILKSEIFSPNPGVHIGSATGHTALVIGGALQRTAYAKSQTGHKSGYVAD